MPPRPAQAAREGLVLGHLPKEQQGGIDQPPRIGGAAPVVAGKETIGQLPKRRLVEGPAKGVVFEQAMNEGAQPAGVGASTTGSGNGCRPIAGPAPAVLIRARAGAGAAASRVNSLATSLCARSISRGTGAAAAGTTCANR